MVPTMRPPRTAGVEDFLVETVDEPDDVLLDGEGDAVEPDKAEEEAGDEAEDEAGAVTSDDDDVVVELGAADEVDTIEVEDTGAATGENLFPNQRNDASFSPICFEPANAMHYSRKAMDINNPGRDRLVYDVDSMLRERQRLACYWDEQAVIRGCFSEVHVAGLGRNAVDDDVDVSAAVVRDKIDCNRRTYEEWCVKIEVGKGKQDHSAPVNVIPALVLALYMATKPPQSLPNTP